MGFEQILHFSRAIIFPVVGKPAVMIPSKVTPHSTTSCEIVVKDELLVSEHGSLGR